MPEAEAIPAQEQIAAALDSEIQDVQGGTTTLRAVCNGQRTVVVFIRHFWCGNCLLYVSKLGVSVPPGNLPPNTQLVIVGCGSYQPIKAYLESSSSPYAVYANPSLTAYTALGFKNNLSGPKKGEPEKAYLADTGGVWGRLVRSLKVGPGRHIEHVGSVGPKGLNGGEAVFEADGTCSFLHVMQHPSDHTDIDELAKVIGAEYTPIPPGKEDSQDKITKFADDSNGVYPYLKVKDVLYSASCDAASAV